MPQILNQDPFIATTTLPDLAVDVTSMNFVASQTFLNRRQSVVSDYRTSESWQDNGQLEWLAQSMLFQIQQDFDHNYDLQNCEKIIVNRYHRNQYYGKHYDYWPDENPRCATALLYLNDDFLGGNTYFDLLDITVRPKKNTLLYWTYPAGASTNDLTSHAGQHVVHGVKYIATMWIRAKSLVVPPAGFEPATLR